MPKITPFLWFEVDDLWKKLTAGGKESKCGWLKDKSGLSWQIVPTTLTKLRSDPARDKAKCVMTATRLRPKIASSFPVAPCLQAGILGFSCFYSWVRV